MIQQLLLFSVLALAALSLSALQIDENPLPSLDNIIQRTADIRNNDDTYGRSASSLDVDIQQYIKRMNASFLLPIIGSTITLQGRNLDENELNFKIMFNSGGEPEARKKSKIKKIFIPILVFILLKAIVLIPLALGILGIKTWNAIQLSFISFVSAAVLAIWKLCSKLNHHHAPAILHNAWDPHHHDRSDIAQQMIYSSYALQ